MEPTPIFAALAAPGRHGDERAGHRSVPDLLRALRTERDVPPPATPRRVGHVPDVLSFRASPRG